MNLSLSLYRVELTEILGVSQIPQLLPLENRVRQGTCERSLGPSVLSHDLLSTQRLEAASLAGQGAKQQSQAFLFDLELLVL